MAGSVRALLDGRAEAAPDAPAVLAPGRAPMPAAGLRVQVDRMVDELRAAGIALGDRVALALPNGPDLAVAFLGTVAAATCAPLATDRPAAEHERDLTAMGARVLVAQRGHDTPARVAAATLGVPVVELEPEATAGAFALHGPGGPLPSGPARAPDDTALLLFTSGTTSRPKLVPLTEANLLASAAHVGTALGLTATDRGLVVMPLFHIHGLVAGLLAPLGSGGSVVCVPGFAGPSVWGWIDEHRPTWYTAVPTIHQAMLDASRARAVTTGAPVPSSLTFVRSSSAALPVPLMEELEHVLGVPVIEAYGMTEAAHQIASNARPPGARTPGSVGRPAGCAVAVLDDAGSPVGAGVVGELAIRGPSVTAGYLDAPEATAAAFRDGWFRTGDQGYVDLAGNLFLTARLKEIINRGGEKVAPREIDDVLLAHPDVVYAAAFGVPHPRLGEEVGVAVVLREGAHVTAPGLRVFAAERLAAWKVPRRIVAVDEIPKGATGKLDRSGLAARLGLADGAAAATAAAVPPTDDLERRVAELWQRVLGEDELPSVECDLFELGGDSLHAVELLAAVEEELGQRLPATVLLDGATVRAMADRLRRGPGDADADAARLVPIQPEGSAPPLFCVMRAGSVVALRHLVGTLGPDQPVYGVWMPAMHGPAGPGRSIEELAATCVSLVRDAYPTGPYALFGHSLGAVVVYETARQLAADGAVVELVGMADGPHPARLRERWAQRHSTRYRVRKLLSRRGPEIVAWRVRQVLGRNPPRPVAYLPGTDAVLDWGATFARERAYLPGPAPVPVTVFATEPYVTFVGTPDLGWADLAPSGSEWIAVPGDHDSMIGEPHVHVLAARLADALRRARARAVSAVGDA